MFVTENKENFEISLQRSMEIIARCVNVDGLEIWRNEMLYGELYAVLRHYWLGEESRRIKSAPIIFKLPYSATPEWDARFSRGECINGPISALSPEDQDFLSSFKMKSTLVLPLLLNNQFWGFCSVDDYHKNRTFTKREMDILRTGCRMIVTALHPE